MENTNTHEPTSTTTNETKTGKTERKATSRKAAKAAKAKTQRKVREGWKLGLPLRADGKTGENECLCGCGTRVKGRFSQGHDARVHSWLLAVEREEKKLTDLPAVTRKAIADGVIRTTGHEHSGRVIVKKAAAKATKQAAQVAA